MSDAGGDGSGGEFARQPLKVVRLTGVACRQANAVVVSHEETTYDGARTLPRLLSIEDVASVLGVSKRTVWRLVASGELRPAGRVGRRLRFRLGDVDAYLEREANP